MTSAKAWTSYNPLTGSKRAWEVYFQVEGFPVRFVSSCADEVSAQKSLKRLIKRCDGMYEFQK